MIRCSFMSRYGLSLLVLLYASIASKSSSTSCNNCVENIQNADCVRKPSNECSIVCNDGYWGNSCQLGRLRLTSRHGYITDGAKNYTSLSKRMWLIEAENSSNSSIHFEIEQLVTECNWDHLYIFDGDSIYSPQLAAFNGHFIAETNSVHAIIPQEIVAKSGKAYIYFYSDGYAEKAGFNISYSIVENCPCSSNGRCNAAGLCLCNPGWSGPICDIKTMNCANCTHGFCNETLGYCVCDRGFTGKDCGQAINSSYWTILNEGHTDNSVYPRASHSSVIVGDWMWVYDGFTLLPSGNTHRKHLSRYDFRENKWQDEPSDLYATKHKWGHTMIAYKGTLIVFGGEMDKKIVRTLAKFKINSSKWDYNEQYGAVAVTGHTATLVGNKMIVIFGLGMDGPFPKVQEYDIETSVWKIINSESSFITARHGHTSVYDRHSELIYVYGGMILSDGNTGSPRGTPTDSLVAYSPRKEEWISLLSSGFKQTLHSAVILDNMMLIYGGNPYVNHDNKDIRCHSSKLLTFDFACQQWNSTELPQLPQRLARYGHTATANGRNMYIFGGFNGAFFNDVLSYTHGDCKMILNETECLEKYYSAGCYWSGGRCVNKGSLAELPECPPKHHKKCDEYKECGACTSSPFGCGWSGGACKVGGETSCPPASKDKCSLFHNCNSCPAEGCSWVKVKNNKMICRKGAQITDCPKKSCANRLESSTCLDGDRCLWCENLNRCIESNLYLFYYQYGQCLEWTNSKTKKQAATCTSKANCQDCHSMPGCGWCEGPKRNGAGRCLDGGGSGPKLQGRCKDDSWHFIECPICQCNGHGNCSSNSSDCLSCTDNTIGKNCESCAPGYFGNPSNGGLCEPCQCNGHADKCDSLSGVCSCQMRGADGDHCERCSQTYVGNATNGGSCYYTLQADYLYKINVSDKTIFNFICSPAKSDRDTIITVDVTEKVKAFPAKLNISMESDIKHEVVLLTNIELVSQYQEKFSKDSFDFASNNFHFKIYVYDIKPYSSVSISVHQPNEQGINLLQFFIIFLACFIGLLILAVVFWKVKASYDAFRSRRRRNVEMVYMTNRPFASVPVCIDKAESIPMKNRPSPLTSEICCGNKAAIVTVLFRMPSCAQKQNASETGTRAGALCLGSTLVSINEHHGSKMINYMKTVKRRRNPFRSSPT